MSVNVAPAALSMEERKEARDQRIATLERNRRALGAKPFDPEGFRHIDAQQLALEDDEALATRGGAVLQRHGDGEVWAAPPGEEE
jgi:hypothetical protein